MGYAYEQRKRPQGPQNTATERTSAAGPVSGALMPGTAAPQSSPSFDLDAAMRERMANTFGDLSAVRDYTPPAREQAPLQTGPCTGPVTHAISSASPSPSAAGPMQAKKATEADYRAKWEGEQARHQEAYVHSFDLQDAPGKVEKRPWELTEEELQANPFNPNNSAELAQHQALLDIKTSPQDTYENFGYTVGAPQAELLDKNKREWNSYELDPKHFKSKLKHMQRMVHDYPELKGTLGNMVSANDSVMAVSPADSKNKAEFDYNTSIDSMGFWGRFKHSLFNWGNRKLGVTNQKSLDYTGTHELGHVLNSLLLNPKNEKDADEDWHYNITADSIVDTALQKTMSEKDYNKLKRHKKTSHKNRYKRGQIDLKGSKLYKKGYTSRYGMTNAAEFFAEAFADVYSHGENAKPVSIEVVKEYEKRREEMKNRPEIEGLDEIPADLPGDDLNDSMIVHTGRKKKH